MKRDPMSSDGPPRCAACAVSDSNLAEQHRATCPTPPASTNAFRDDFWTLATIDKRENFKNFRYPKKCECADQEVTTTKGTVWDLSQMRWMCRQRLKFSRIAPRAVIQPNQQ